MSFMDVLLVSTILLYVATIVRQGDNLLDTVQALYGRVIGRRLTPLNIFFGAILAGLSSLFMVYWFIKMGASPYWYLTHPPITFLLYAFLSSNEYRFRKSFKGEKLPTPEECLGRILERSIKRKEARKKNEQ